MVKSFFLTPSSFISIMCNVNESAVVTCFLESKGKILILKRSEKVGTYEGKWAGVSGYIETTPDEQAFKEIKEETGLNKSDIKLVKRGKPFSFMDKELNRKWVVHPYLFYVKRLANININWEHLEMKWILPEELTNYPTVPNLKQALERVWKFL